MSVVNIGAYEYDIYGDLDLADEYLSGALHTYVAWEAADDDGRARALVTATRFIDRQLWQGAKTSGAQALQWPRSGVVDAYGNAVSSASVPDDLLNGYYELAALIMDDAEEAQAEPSASTNVKRVKAGSAEIEFFKPESRGRFTTIIDEYLGQFLRGAGDLFGDGLAQSWGTDSTSAFDGDDTPDFEGGL